MVLKSPDLEQELLLIELSNNNGRNVYSVSDLLVTPRFDGQRSSATVEGEASVKAISLIEEYLSDADQKRIQREAQPDVDMTPYTTEATLNVQRDKLLYKWRFVLGDVRFSHPVSSNVFVEMNVVKDENGIATITTGDFQTDTMNGFYNETLERKLNLPLDPTYLGREKVDRTKCLFDIETDVRKGRFKGEILPKERCGANIQALLSNYEDKTQALEAGQVMFIPAENDNAALFIENFEGNLFVTQVEILPTVKMVQETLSDFSINYTQMFPALCKAYQEERLWEHN